MKTGRRCVNKALQGGIVVGGGSTHNELKHPHQLTLGERLDAFYIVYAHVRVQESTYTY